MRLFDYQCKECGHVFEKIMRAGSDEPKCPECNADTKRLSLFETGSAPSVKPVQWVYMDSQAQRPFSTKRGLLNDMARRRDAISNG